MLYIDGTNIKLTRGDTSYLTFPITMNGEAYAMKPEDTLYLTVKKTVNDTEYCFQRSSVGSNIIHIEPSDTKPFAFGKYKYDVELRLGDGDIFTVIDTSTFEILSEVTD